MVTPVSDHDSVLELVGAIKENLPMLLREVCTLDRSSTQGFTFKPTWKKLFPLCGKYRFLFLIYISLAGDEDQAHRDGTE